MTNPFEQIVWLFWLVIDFLKENGLNWLVIGFEKFTTLAIRDLVNFLGANRTFDFSGDIFVRRNTVLIFAFLAAAIVLGALIGRIVSHFRAGTRLSFGEIVRAITVIVALILAAWNLLAGLAVIVFVWAIATFVRLVMAIISGNARLAWSSFWMLVLAVYVNYLVLAALGTALNV